MVDKIDIEINPLTTGLFAFRNKIMWRSDRLGQNIFLNVAILHGDGDLDLIDLLAQIEKVLK